MRAFFVDLFEYNRKRNLEMNLLCLNHERDIPEKTIQLFSHNLNAHHIWNKRILDEEQRFGVWDIHVMNSWNSVDEQNFNDSIRLLEGFELDQVIEFKNSKGQSYENVLRDLLFHIINHTNYHRAQIVTNLLEAGIQPGKTDFIYYKR